MNILVVDYGLGNTKSVMSALKYHGAKPLYSNDHNDILGADAVILPGVGAFPHGMLQLKKYNLISPLIEYAQTGKPLLGICLGMQMLLSKGFEFEPTPGLGLIAGEVVPLASDLNLHGRIPHVGWSTLEEPTPKRWVRTILSETKPNISTYFVHSFIAKPEDQRNTLAITPYQGVNFCSAIQHENIYGCQFHPEKSGPEGLNILKNFLAIASRTKK